jgi:type IV secretion system protein VirB10
MSGADVETGPVAPPKEDPEALVLRGRPRPAVRFRRGLIVGVTAAVATSVVGLAWVALEPPSLRKAASAFENDQPAQRSADETLANVPKSYGDVPRLGPPLPGDLGRPILEHERSLGEAAAPAMASQGPAIESERAQAIAAERQRLESERQAARSSAVLVQLQGSRADGAASPGTVLPQAADGASPNAAAVPPSQSRKIEFARSSDGEVSTNFIRPGASRWLLSAGTVIPASLVTGLNSDLPGMVLAQVTENVRDSATGSAILVPQGSRLIGAYDSIVAYGQRRALVAWKRIIFPDGSSVTLDNVPATDAGGYAGVRDGVDSHTWQLLKGIALSTLLGVGTQLSFGGSESDLVRAIRESAQQNAAHAGDQITMHNLEVQPTLTVRPGWPIRAVLNKDLVLSPWRG